LLLVFARAHKKGLGATAVHRTCFWRGGMAAEMAGMAAESVHVESFISAE
jgi:hypothetical protein